MLLLQSPSRGIEHAHSESSLKNPLVQERFRDHITILTNGFDQRQGSQTLVDQKGMEELSIILLELRKLREGTRSIHRQDAFAIEVYETSTHYAILASNHQQLSSCLPYLIHDLYPLSPSSTSLSVAGLSLDAGSTLPDRRLDYIALYLTYSLVHLSPTAFRTLFATIAVPPFSLHPKVVYVTLLHNSIITTNYAAYSSLILDPPDAIDSRQMTLAQLGVSEMRERSWKVIRAGYKVFGDTEWLRRMLVLDTTEETRNFLREKGVAD